ncbi:MAG: DUF4175 family protein [Elusimicrobia bacterium]|nr:DUF4175 family protein [Elusimicrobiota bacterium]
MDNINKLISSAKLKLSILYILKTSLYFLSSVLLIVFLNYATDYFGVSSFTLRMILWVLLVIFAVYLLVKTILTVIYLKTADEDLAILIQKNNGTLKDDLINAVQLKKTPGYGISDELREAFIDITSVKISQDNIKSGVTLGSLRNIFIIFVVLLLNFVLFYGEFRLKRSLLPFASRTYLTVMPEDTTASIGSDVNIYAVTKLITTTPYLFFRETDGSWQTKKMRKMGENNYYEKIEKITEDTEYYVKLLDNKSRRYKIKIVSPLAVSVTQIEYIYPSYAGMSNRTVKESEIEAPAGTTIIVTADSNKNLNEAFLLTDTNEKIRAEVRKKRIQAKFVIQNQSKYWLSSFTEDRETTGDPVKYSINIVKNNPPQIKIIAPAFDVMISENGIMRIVYSAEDDFGLSEIFINYLSLNKRKSIKTFSKPALKALEEYNISISKLDLKPGDVVTYRLEASDNSASEEKVQGYSETYKFEVLSYEMEHALIEHEVSEFNMLLNEILSRQLQSKTALSKEDLENALKMQENARKLLENAVENFKKTVSKMGNDPFTNYQVYTEYKNLQEMASELGSQKMPQASKSISDKNLTQAEQLQSQIIEELKKLSSFSENIAKNQKMEDMLSTTREMSDSAGDIEKKLQEMKSMPDAEKLKELQDATKKLSDLLGELAKKVAGMPRETPENFANNENMKKIDLSQMRMTADEMRWTLESGNIDKAIELAQKLSRQISDILQGMENAAQSSMSESYSRLQEQMNQSANELEKIIMEQEKILSQTQELDKKRLEKVLELQKQLLKKLAEKQKQAIKELADSKEIIKQSTTTLPSTFNMYAGPESRMNVVLSELASEKIDKTREYLPNIISELDKILEKVTEELPNKHVLTSKTIEQEILDNLTKFDPPKKDVFTRQELDKHTQLSGMQKTNQDKTQQLKQMLSEISERTLSLPPDIIQKMSSASKNMNKAVTELSQADTEPAVVSEKKALEDLLNGQESMQGASQQMMQMMAGSKPMMVRGNQQLRMGNGGAPGGFTGFRTDFIKIPSAKDYKPPKEFRESIIESLRKNYPPKYAPIIKEYFKRLIE